MEYIWLDSNGEFRSKVRSNREYIKSPEWNYDGSSTGQATTEDSDVILTPIKVVNSPFASSSLVLCDSKERQDAMKVFKK